MVSLLEGVEKVAFKLITVVKIVDIVDEALHRSRVRREREKQMKTAWIVGIIIAIGTIIGTLLHGESRASGG